MDKSGRVTIRLNQYEQSLLQDCIITFESRMKKMGLPTPTVSETSIFKEALSMYHQEKIVNEKEEFTGSIVNFR